MFTDDLKTQLTKEQKLEKILNTMDWSSDDSGRDFMMEKEEAGIVCQYIWELKNKNHKAKNFVTFMLAIFLLQTAFMIIFWSRR